MGALPSEVSHCPPPGPTVVMAARRGPLGEEIAWRTLGRERVPWPCIRATGCMKRQFFRVLTGREDIYADPVATTVEAFVRAGANLLAQFIMPSPHPEFEHLAVSPFQATAIRDGAVRHDPWLRPTMPTPEAVRDHLETLPDPDTLVRTFDVEAAADAYARPLRQLRDLARGAILFINGFGQTDFMGPYTAWGFESYLAAIALYPDHIARYYAYTGEQARLRNLAIARAVEKHALAPFVYGGQDICFNDGPICAPATLDALYFPHLVRAVEPLHAAGIGIVWHCDGDIRPIRDRLLEDVGVSGFQGFQEETGCTLEGMAGVRTRDGRQPILWGSVSVTTTLPYGTVEGVKRDVERCFKVAAPGGGFALGSSSSILPETPLENILAVYEHGQRFGREFLGGRGSTGSCS